MNRNIFGGQACVAYANGQCYASVYSATAQLSEGGELFILEDLELATPLELIVGASKVVDGVDNRYENDRAQALNKY